MSCQQNQQQCRPLPKCPSPKCPAKIPVQCLPPDSSGRASSSGGCGPSSEGGCCLSHHRYRGSHRCQRQSSNSCDGGSGQQGRGSSCAHSSGSAADLSHEIKEKYWRKGSAKKTGTSPRLGHLCSCALFPAEMFSEECQVLPQWVYPAGLSASLLL
ncbi:late cornified envelope protein 3D-like [Sapajus apella]|uniref:Late cornified envelope protein 3D-like n=1 Tax=Sapajus apella TaxID=9515 RepID=A0A6J3HB75_SAPAP|nr:late cornified envelope protein 3D-like [Sapajus apella]